MVVQVYTIAVNLGFHIFILKLILSSLSLFLQNVNACVRLVFVLDLYK